MPGDVWTVAIPFLFWLFEQSNLEARFEGKGKKKEGGERRKEGGKEKESVFLSKVAMVHNWEMQPAAS